MTTKKDVILEVRRSPKDKTDRANYIAQGEADLKECLKALGSINAHFLHKPAADALTNLKSHVTGLADILSKVKRFGSWVPMALKNMRYATAMNHFTGASEDIENLSNILQLNL